MKCSKCGLQGYLFEEKKRPRVKRIYSKYKFEWSRKEHKPYGDRPKHRYASFIHNIKRDGKWTIKKCYLCVIPEKKCNCEICNTHTDVT